MELFLDDSPIDSALVGDGTVEESLHQVQSNVCASGKVVVGLRCNGEELTGDAMIDALKRPAASFDRIEVFSGTKTDLVIDAMRQASSCLDETNAACMNVSQLLTEGRTVEAAEALGGCLTMWQQIHEAVAKSIEMLGIDVEHATINDQPALAMIARPKKVLLQMKESLQARDYVLLADILQYEFCEVTDLWREVVGWIQQQAEQAQTGSPS